jgi:hypothetical protein
VVETVRRGGQNERDRVQEKEAGAQTRVREERDRGEEKGGGWLEVGVMQITVLREYIYMSGL